MALCVPQGATQALQKELGPLGTGTPRTVRDKLDAVRGSYVYSDLVGYQTSDIRLLWTITPPPTPTPFLPLPPVSDFAPPPPPPVSPPISDLSHCHHTLEV